MNFVIGFLISADWKGNNYNLILVIIDQLIKMIHYELLKVTINTPSLAKMIINIVVCHHKVLELIAIN